MVQPPLPGMPEEPLIDAETVPMTAEHVVFKVYPPTRLRPCWTVLTTHQWPGGSTVLAKELPPGLTPHGVGQHLLATLQERMLELEPF